MEKYSVKSIRQILADSHEITFLKITSFSDGTLVKVEGQTYVDDLPVSELRLVLKDTRRRRKETYQKAGVTKEECSDGLETEEFSQAFAQYFADHPGLIVGHGIEKTLPEINHMLNEPLRNKFLDTHAMSLFCKDSCNGMDVKEVFETCLRIYARLERVERNKLQCVLKSVSYWEQKIRNKWTYARSFLFFRTSVGTIYYDLDREKWDMSRKERTRTGLVVESFDLDDVVRQAFRKYGVRSLTELEMKIRANAKASCA